MPHFKPSSFYRKSTSSPKKGQEEGKPSVGRRSPSVFMAMKNLKMSKSPGQGSSDEESGRDSTSLDEKGRKRSKVRKRVRRKRSGARF